jgi:hypothetical protein
MPVPRFNPRVRNAARTPHGDRRTGVRALPRIEVVPAHVPTEKSQPRPSSGREQKKMRTFIAPGVAWRRNPNSADLARFPFIGASGERGGAVGNSREDE